MPGYRFTTDNGVKVDKDDEPMAFPDDKAAADAVQEALADMAKEELPDGSALDLSASVERDDGKPVYRASLKFKGETAEEAEAAAAADDAATDEAVEAVQRALDTNKT